MPAIAQVAPSPQRDITIRIDRDLIQSLNPLPQTRQLAEVAKLLQDLTQLVAGMGGMNPLMGGMNPMMGGMNPMMGGMNPMMGGMNPLMGGMNPLMGGMNPMMGGMNPMMGGPLGPLGAMMNPPQMNPIAQIVGQVLDQLMNGQTLGSPMDGGISSATRPAPASAPADTVTSGTTGQNTNTAPLTRERVAVGQPAPRPETPTASILPAKVGNGAPPLDGRQAPMSDNQAKQVLLNNFDRISNNGMITLQAINDLAAGKMPNGAGAPSQELQQAAQRMRDDTNLFKKTETADLGGATDMLLSKGDLQASLVSNSAESVLRRNYDLLKDQNGLISLQKLNDLAAGQSLPGLNPPPADLVQAAKTFVTDTSRFKALDNATYGGKTDMYVGHTDLDKIIAQQRNAAGQSQMV